MVQFRTTDVYATPQCKFKDNGVSALKKVSDKQKSRNESYLLLRKAFLHRNPECQVHHEGCSNIATTVHHKRGKIGENYLDVSTFLGACMSCHVWVETHPNEAKEQGYSLSRLAK